VPYDIGTATANAVWSIGGEGLFLPDVESLFTPLRRTIATAFAHYELSPGVEVFSEFWAAQSRAVEVVNQPAYQSGLFSAESESLLFSVDHPLLSPSARDTILGYGFDEFYLQRASADLRPDGNRSTGKTNMLRGVIGLRGEFAAADRNFTWDASYNRGRTDTINGNTDLSNQRFFYALDAVVADDGSIQCRVVADPSSRPDDPADFFNTFIPGNVYSDCVPLDLFGEGRPSQEAVEYISIIDYASTVIDQEVFEANLGTTELFDLPAGGFGVNFGVSRRTESGSFETSGFTQLGLGRSTPVLPVAGEFQSDEVYAEFYAPLFSEDMDIPGISYITMEGAYRYLDNDFAGTDSAWTVGLKYSPIPDLEFRGNVTRSVRAPAITELFLPLSGTFTFSADPCDAVNIDSGPNPSARAANCASGGGDLPPITQPFTSTVRNASVEGLSGGNTGLNNETADAWTVGVIFRPRFAEGLQLSVDYIDFDIEDAIETFTLTQLMEACYDSDTFPNPFCSDFRRQPDGQVPPRDAFTVGKVNAGARTYQAFTVEAQYSFDALQGQFDIGGSLLNIRQFDRLLLGTLTDFTGEITNGASEWQWNVLGRYSRDNWSAFLQPRYIGEGIWDNDASENQYSIPGNDAVWIWNGGFSYDINDQVALQLNVNNLFDELPSPASIATGNSFVYDNIGRFYRLSLRVSL
jgi:outer membrane receptor protein involved in Fe transport